jgi:hypothetical protein
MTFGIGISRSWIGTFEQDDAGYLHSSTMQELSMDDNIGVENDQDEITLEKQLANNNLLPFVCFFQTLCLLPYQDLV